VECRFSVMRWKCLGAGVLALGLYAGPAVADHAVVLVARADAQIASIDPLDLRKLYLGLLVRTPDDVAIRAAINRSDAELYEIFLQVVMAMSSRAYDRRLLTLTLQAGRRRPDAYLNGRALVQAIKDDAHLVTFMWMEDTERAGDLKVLRVLWKR
jgi:hypothetical protein